MRIPLQISFHEVDQTEALEAAIRDRASKLERFSDDIMSCRVAVEAPHRRQQRGTHYRVRIDLTVPGDELVVARDPSEHDAHEDVFVAIRDAFHAARRQLEDYERKRRGQVKQSRGALHGRVVSLFPDQGYGFLAADDGHEVYFHRNSVLDDFDALTVGTRVRYSEEPGDQGPQASTVATAGGQRGR